MYVIIAMIDATFNEGTHYYWMPDVLLSTDMNCITQPLLLYSWNAQQGYGGYVISETDGFSEYRCHRSPQAISTTSSDSED